ncbi:putative inorganic carbon transporter subunit DabA [Gemmatimonas sp.]|uniref:putative inorganic carbon transporter subunit DabA n=1 Tax=Gemmatimonas sp. TaxID=1962908 RepID=UPI003DA6682E
MCCAKRCPTQSAVVPELSTFAATGAPVDLSSRVSLAAGVLRAMNLTRDFAPLVALIGHGASTQNNPQAAGLHCGACGGQTGEVNARALASLLNDEQVRAGLRAEGSRREGHPVHWWTARHDLPMTCTSMRAT